jgi:hypothetical protein
MKTKMNYPTEENDILDKLQKDAFRYFEHETNHHLGLVPDSDQPNSPASIAAIGLGITCAIVAAERGFIRRERARESALRTLRTFHLSTQGKESDTTGYRGFYYHFLDMNSVRRTWQSELSSIDTALLVVGFLAAAQYYDQDNAEENEIRTLADALYRRVEWDWMLNGGPTVSHGWKPGRGFLKYRWDGYSEGLLLYVLALGSPTHPIPPESYRACTANYEWRSYADHEYLHAGPLFIHQLPQCWLDLRHIQDEYMRDKKLTYFENSRRATYIQQAYAIKNPNEFIGYGADCWGITASDGPGRTTKIIKGRKHKFYGYTARGVPDGPDDGTIAPWGAVSSMPFTPEIIYPTIRHFWELNIGENTRYGFEATFNQTIHALSAASDHGWVSPYNYGLNQGPVVLMVENFRTGLIWRLMRKCPYIIQGLRRAGFTGGWLG